MPANGFEVSIVKAIVARDGREGGIIGVPGAEGAFGWRFRLWAWRW